MKFKKHPFLNRRNLIISLSALACFSFSTVLVQAQEGDMSWIKSYGGSGSDSFVSMAKTPDGGYIAVGYTNSADGDLSKNSGNTDFLLGKFDMDGEKQWVKSYGGSNADYLYGIKPTRDGGYVAAGYSSSNNGDIPGSKGNQDMILAKFNSNGDKQWIKNYGGSGSDFFYDVVQVSNGDYIAVGYTASSNGDITGPKGSTDAVMARFDSNGNKIWMKNIGGTKQETFNKVNLTKDGNLILTAESSSTTGDLIGNRGYADMVIAKYDTNGNQLWHKSYGGSKNDLFKSVLETSDGGFIGVGYSDSTTGDMAGSNKGGLDGIIIKLDSNGNKVWMKNFGGTGSDMFYSVLESPDGGYVGIGFTNSPANAEVPAINGVSDALLVKYDISGNFMWSKAFGGSGGDNFMDGVVTKSGDYMLAGSTYSSEYIIKGGPSDAILVKVEGDHTPPAEVNNLSETHNHNSVTLNWTNPTDKYFDHVNVYRDNTLVQSVSGNYFYESGLKSDGTNYEYKLTTVDQFGNESDGTRLDIKTIDITPPVTPLNIAASGKDGIIQLNWDGNSESDLYGYNIFLNGVKQNTSPIQNNYYQLTGLNNGETYQVSVSAVDKSNNESSKSDELKVYVFDTIAPNSPSLSVLNYDARTRKITFKLDKSDLDTWRFNLYSNGSMLNTIPIQDQIITLDLFPGIYHFSATALDQYLNESVLSQPLEFTVDGIPPAIPLNIIGEGKNEKINVKWDSNSEDDLAGYNIYLNGIKQNTSPVTDIHYEISNLKDGETYQVSVSAIDTSYNESEESASVSVQVKDTIPPEAPEITQFNYDQLLHSLNLKIKEKTPDTKGYNIYLYNDKKNKTLIDTPDILLNLAPGIYVITVTAVDDFGNESSESSALTFVVKQELPKPNDAIKPVDPSTIVEIIKNRDGQITGTPVIGTKPSKNADKGKDDTSYNNPSQKGATKNTSKATENNGDDSEGNKLRKYVSLSTPKSLVDTTKKKTTENDDEQSINSGLGNLNASSNLVNTSKESDLKNTKESNKDSSTSNENAPKEHKWILWASVAASVLSIGAIGFLITKMFILKK
ncbi:fibronectin type III domain-containing protein [Priestia aryabhattai]